MKGLVVIYARGRIAVWDYELFDEGSNEENPGCLRVKGPLRDTAKSDPLSYRRHLSALDGHPQLEPCPARQSRVALFSQEPFNRTDRNLHPFFGQKPCDFSGRQAMFSPIADLGPGSSINAMPSGFALGQGFGEVDLFMGEEVSEEIHIGRRISEALGNHLGRQAIDEGGAQGLIAALPFMHWVEEEFLVAHESLIAHDGYNVNSQIIKILYKPIFCQCPEEEDKRVKAYFLYYSRPEALD